MSHRERADEADIATAKLVRTDLRSRNGSCSRSDHDEDLDRPEAEEVEPDEEADHDDEAEHEEDVEHEEEVEPSLDEELCHRTHEEGSLRS